jgi:hypothetical protein
MCRDSSNFGRSFASLSVLRALCGELVLHTSNAYQLTAEDARDAKERKRKLLNLNELTMS